MPESRTARIAGFTGSLIGPGDGGYDAARSIWNGDVDRRPRLIARPAGADDVARVLRWAHDHVSQVSVLAGGHNVSGAALCDGLVVDLSGMREVTVDVPGRRATVQGGARWRDVDGVTQAHGLVVPGGVMSLTGVAGLTLGGGFGWLRRALGLSSDSVVGFELVTATGRRLHVDADSDPELFWALRGAGAGLGVVTAFGFTLHPLGGEVAFAAATYPAADWVAVGAAYVAFAERTPETVTTSLLFGTVPTMAPWPEQAHGQQFLAVVGMYCGDPLDGEEVLAPLRELGGAQPWLDLSGRRPHVDVQRMFDANYPDGGAYYWTSTFLDDLPVEALDQAVRWSAAAPSPASVVAFWQLGGAVAREPVGGSAFGNRGARYLLGVEANGVGRPPSTTDDLEWARACREAFAPFSSSGDVYANLPGDADQDAVHRQADGGTRARLEAVRARVDPLGLFTASR